METEISLEPKKRGRKPKIDNNLQQAPLPVKQSPFEESDKLSKEDIMDATAEHQRRYLIKVVFPDDNHWLMTIPFDDTRWYDTVQTRNMAQQIESGETEWSVSGNMSVTIKDVVDAADSLVSQKRFFRPVRSAPKERNKKD